MKYITYNEHYFNQFEHYFEIPYAYNGEFHLALKSKLHEYFLFFKHTIAPNFFDGIVVPGLDDEGEIDFSKGDDNTGGNHFTSLISQLIDAINEAVDLHYQGKLYESYNSFYNVLKNQLIYDKLLIMNYIPSKYMFRLRKVSNKDNYENKYSIFHLPFDLRGKVAQQRYSISGFPSLYLGEDVFVCCKELEVDLSRRSDYIGSVFALKGALKVFQFLRIEQFNDRYVKTYEGHNRNNIIYDYFLTFPLIIACSFRVKDAYASFKPEYIIPQMLLSFIRQDSKIDGILYSSTKVDYSELKNEHPYNLVLPVKNIDSVGYCDTLESYFNWCSPIQLKNAPRKFDNKNFPEFVTRRMTAKGFYNGKKLSNYSNTPYGKIESLLFNEYLKQK